MIDIHSHLIPGMDDGSQSLRQSMDILRVFAEAGVSDVVLTPHVSASELSQDMDGVIERRDAAFDELRRVGLATPKLHLGFEIMLDEPLSPLTIGDRRFSLAGSKYYLVEFPYGVVSDFAAAVLSKIAQAGVTPIVAHPERYDACSPSTVAHWRSVGAKMQLDATSLTRATRRGQRARQLLSGGLVDVIAADNHGNNRILTTGVHYLVARDAEQQAEVLSVANPAAVLDGREMAPVPPVLLKEGFLGRWRRFVSG